MRKSSGNLEPDAAGGHQALVTLRRGVSAWGAWAFDAVDAGRTITVGAGAVCDWQIASPGIAPLYLAFTGESLLVRGIEPDDRVRLNGRVLPEGWVRLSHGDMLDLGPSKLAVSLSSTLQPRKTRRAQRGKQSRRKVTKHEAPPPRSPPPGSGAGVWPEASAGPEAAAGLILHPDALRNAPALFQEEEHTERTSQNRRMVYAAIAFGTLLAYAGWLTLLDEL